MADRHHSETITSDVKKRDAPKTSPERRQRQDSAKRSFISTLTTHDDTATATTDPDPTCANLETALITALPPGEIDLDIPSELTIPNHRAETETKLAKYYKLLPANLRIPCALCLINKRFHYCGILILDGFTKVGGIRYKCNACKKTVSSLFLFQMATGFNIKLNNEDAAMPWIGKYSAIWPNPTNGEPTWNGPAAENFAAILTEIASTTFAFGPSQIKQSKINEVIATIEAFTINTPTATLEKVRTTTESQGNSQNTTTTMEPAFSWNLINSQETHISQTQLTQIRTQSPSSPTSRTGPTTFVPALEGSGAPSGISNPSKGASHRSGGGFSGSPSAGWDTSLSQASFDKSKRIDIIGTDSASEIARQMPATVQRNLQETTGALQESEVAPPVSPTSPLLGTSTLNHQQDVSPISDTGFHPDAEDQAFNYFENVDTAAQETTTPPSSHGTPTPSEMEDLATLEDPHEYHSNAAPHDDDNSETSSLTSAINFNSSHKARDIDAETLHAASEYDSTSNISADSSETTHMKLPKQSIRDTTSDQHFFTDTLKRLMQSNMEPLLQQMQDFSLASDRRFLDSNRQQQGLFAEYQGRTAEQIQSLAKVITTSSQNTSQIINTAIEGIRTDQRKELQELQAKLDAERRLANQRLANLETEIANLTLPANQIMEKLAKAELAKAKPPPRDPLIDTLLTRLTETEAKIVSLASLAASNTANVSQTQNRTPPNGSIDNNGRYSTNNPSRSTTPTPLDTSTLTGMELLNQRTPEQIQHFITAVLPDSPSSLSWSPATIFAQYILVIVSGWNPEMGYAQVK
ncbi:hypothetical protein HDU98_003722, partial [Podochytrium sp. JEL0797]